MSDVMPLRAKIPAQIEIARALNGWFVTVDPDKSLLCGESPKRYVFNDVQEMSRAIIALTLHGNYLPGHETGPVIREV